MTALLSPADLEPAPVDDVPVHEDRVTCVACDHGGVPTGDPAAPMDSCPVCDGTGFVSLAGWLAGQEVAA